MKIPETVKVLKFKNKEIKIYNQNGEENIFCYFVNYKKMCDSFGDADFHSIKEAEEHAKKEITLRENKKINPLEEKFITCTCFSPEHVLRFTYDPDEPEEIYTETYLNQYRNIFKRIIVAIKYVFGYKSKYGDWDVVSLNRDKAKELRDFLNKFINKK